MLRYSAEQDPFYTTGAVKALSTRLQGAMPEVIIQFPDLGSEPESEWTILIEDMPSSIRNIGLIPGETKFRVLVDKEGIIELRNFIPIEQA